MTPSDSSSFMVIQKTGMTDMKFIFFNLCEDKRLLVRKEAAQALSNCYKEFGESTLSEFFIHIQLFMSDEVYICRLFIDL
jgi:hypothetical protein